MASNFSPSEHQINLSVLQNKDPFITKIEDSASQVATYSFNSLTNEWEKTNIEGTLFVYSRSASPTNGFTIINRLHPSDLVELINKNLEIQLQDPFLLYRNSKSAIFSIWFYDRDECARIGQLVSSLAQMAGDGQLTKMPSESDSESTVITKGVVAVSEQPVDILQMLSKAQDEFDKTRQPEQTSNQASSTTNDDKEMQHPTATHISLEVLFKKAQLHNPIKPFDQKLICGGTNSAFHLPATSMHKQPTPTVEQIERAHLSDKTGSGVSVESPNSTLKRSLKIIDPSHNQVVSAASIIKVPTIMSQITNTSNKNLTKPTITPTNYTKATEKKASKELPVPSSHSHSSNSLVQALFTSHQKQQRHAHSPNNKTCPSHVDDSRTFSQFPFNSHKSPHFPPPTISPPQTPTKPSLPNNILSPIYSSWIETEKSSSKLMSPFAFKANSKRPIKQQPQHMNGEAISKEELKSTLIGLLNTDSTFLKTIHDAYIENINKALNSTK